MKVCGETESLTDFVPAIDYKLVNIQSEYSPEAQKELIISLIKSDLKLVKDKKSADKTEVTSLAEFISKSVYAHQRIKERNFSYEFPRLPKSLQDELEDAIAQVLHKRYQRYSCSCALSPPTFNASRR